MDEEFREQIKEDIKLIQKDYGYIDDQIQQDDYAFNYWVLSNLFGLDEESCPPYITDNSKDKGIDCFVHYAETKELYIIQNKYYDEKTALTPKEVTYFLQTPLTVLLDGNYKRSEELQTIFNSIYDDSDYKIWLHLYVTNDISNTDIDKLINQFSFQDDRIKAFIGVKLYRLPDIKNLYYNERFTEKVDFTATLTTRVSATSLDVRPNDYGLDWMIDLRFIMANVADLYELYKEAEKKNYELFEENVREFLGTQGINNGIIKTLKSLEDRENFFYYNNGITLICESCETLRGTEASKGASKNNTYGFKLKNPQIVNGCQTINSIVEVLSHCNEKTLLEEYEKTYVLVKIYVFDEKTKEDKAGLDKNIVKYTNSQTGIDEKAFASKKDYFLNLQKEFEKRGVLLLVKPSDKNKYSKEYKDKTKYGDLRKKSAELFKLFAIDNSKFDNYTIKLEKLLKVLMAFDQGGYAAFVKGCMVLKPNSQSYKDFSLKIDQIFTIENMINIYFLFKQAEIEQKASNDKRTPIPYYVISFLGDKFKDMDFVQKNDKLKQLFSNKQTLDEVYEFYKNLTSLYAGTYEREKNIEYNQMTKKEVDPVILNREYNNLMNYGVRDAAKEYLKSLN